VCFEGTRAEVRRLKDAAQNAANADLSLDKQNCVTDVRSRGDKRFDEVRGQFQSLVDSKDRFTVAFTRDAEATQDDPLRVVVYERANATDYPIMYQGRCGGARVNQTFPGQMLHELAHHFPVPLGQPMAGEAAAIRTENVYHRATRGAGFERCAH